MAVDPEEAKESDPISVSRPPQNDATLRAGLAPQTRRPYHGATPSRPLLRRVGYGSFLFALLVYGLVFAFFAPYLAPLLVLPILILSVVAIWALPSDGRRPPERLLEWLFYAFLVVRVAWPNYLAIVIPGLPWITLLRLVDTPMVVTLLVCASTSKSFRAIVFDHLKVQPITVSLLVSFVVIQALSIVMSGEKGVSTEEFVNAQLSQTSVFFIAIFVFSRKSRAELWTRILWALVVFVGTIALIEYKMRHIVWAGHVPAFLQIQDENVAKILQGAMRAGTSQYRAQSTFSTSLGLSEFNALALPFILYLAFQSKRLVWRVLAAATVPFLLLVTLATGSRLGMVGACVTFLMYTFIWGVRRWRLQRGDIVGPAVVLTYPIMASAFLAATLFVGRLRRVVWGGGETALSTDARKTQYAMGIPKVLHNPFGYGIGQDGVVLNFRDPSGRLTVDTYYLATALQYGVLGFVAYYGMFAWPVIRSLRIILLTELDPRGAGVLIPACVSIANFLVIKSVFAQEDNHPLVFMILAMVVVASGERATPKPTAAAARLP
ncbi:MAG TPA: O-antigen ligase family protein [Caulobacteraceae bacterium]|jgi:hypothetical protein